MSVIKIRIKAVEKTEEYLNVKEIRRRVFQIEQAIDSSLDFDGKDEDACHFIAYCNLVPAGTARVRYFIDGPESARIERVAVLPEFRGNGVGRITMEYVLNFLKDRWFGKAELNAQDYIKSFYEKIGFKQTGEPFENSGILHIRMEIILHKWGSF